MTSNFRLPLSFVLLKIQSFLLICLSVRTSSGFQQTRGFCCRYQPFRSPLRPSRAQLLGKLHQAWHHSFISSRCYSSLDKQTDLVLDHDGDNSSLQLGAWVPMASVSCLQGLGPTEIEVFGTRFAVWESSQKKGSKWSVLVDECPHRYSPLSLGRVDPHTNCLECPYHGWQFDTKGNLRKIPHLESNAELRPETRSVQSFETHLTGDLLWAFLPTSFHGESFPKSLLPEDYYKDLMGVVERNLTFYTQELPFSFDFLAENALDGPSHAYFAHHKFGFDRAEASPIPCLIPVSNFTDLVTEVTYLRKGIERKRRYSFQRPFLLSNQVPVGNNDWKVAIHIFAIPVREGFSRLLTNFETLKPHPLTPDWLLHIINKRFLDGDLIMHNTEIAVRKKESNIPKYIHATSSDASVKAWRNWWFKFGLSEAPRNSFSPASSDNLKLIDRQQLVDPWRLHTSKCSKCRTVLKRSKRIQKVGWLVAWGVFALSRRHPVGSLILGLLGIATFLGAGGIIRELEGPFSKSEVGDRTLSAAAE